MGRLKVEGEFPTKAPSTSISAPVGFEETVTLEDCCISGFGDSFFVMNVVLSRGTLPLINAVIAVPFGIVMSLPCINRKNGAAGQTTIAVATIAPVIAPT